jgi:hypothetical protein
MASNSYAGRSHANTGMMSGVREGLTMTVEAPGLDEMIERLQKYAAIGDTDAKRVRAGMSKTVKLVFGKAEGTVPVRTGKLKATLFSQTKTWAEGNVTGNVGSKAASLSYGGHWGGLVPFVLEGGRHPNHNGRMTITPRRWLYHAYKLVKDQVDEIWKKVIDQITNDLAGKT